MKKIHKDEIPILLCLCTGSFICGLISLYRNSLVCKKEADTSQLVYGWLCLLSALLSIWAYASCSAILAKISSLLGFCLLAYLLVALVTKKNLYS